MALPCSMLRRRNSMPAPSRLISWGAKGSCGQRLIVCCRYQKSLKHIACRRKARLAKSARWPGRLFSSHSRHGEYLSADFADNADWKAVLESMSVARKISLIVLATFFVL